MEIRKIGFFHSVLLSRMEINEVINGRHMKNYSNINKPRTLGTQKFSTSFIDKATSSFPFSKSAFLTNSLWWVSLTSTDGFCLISWGDKSGRRSRAVMNWISGQGRENKTEISNCCRKIGRIGKPSEDTFCSDSQGFQLLESNFILFMRFSLLFFSFIGHKSSLALQSLPNSSSPTSHNDRLNQVLQPWALSKLPLPFMKAAGRREARRSYKTLQDLNYNSFQLSFFASQTACLSAFVEGLSPPSTHQQMKRSYESERHTRKLIWFPTPHL